MLKKPTFLISVSTLITMIFLFRIKYEVQTLEQLRERLKSEIGQVKESLHVLNAEWSYLNDPKRLQNLCAKYLPHLKPVNSNQLITLTDMTQAGGRSESDENLDVYMSQLLENELSNEAKR